MTRRLKLKLSPLPRAKVLGVVNFPIFRAAMIPGVDAARCRTPEILADAAWHILTSDARTTSGHFYIDDTVLAEHGVTDLERYSVTPGTKEFVLDFFVD